jgi:hypothetical protein
MDTPDTNAVQVTVAEEKPKKKRGSQKGAPRTEAQIAATAKAFASLQAKRQQAKEDADKEEATMDNEAKQSKLKEKYEKAKLARKALPPVPNYVTVSDLNAFKNDLLQFMPKTVYKEVPGPERVVYRDRQVPVDKVEVKEVVKEKPVVISGNQLLDSIFFKNK